MACMMWSALGWGATLPLARQVEKGNALFAEGKYDAAQQVYATAQVDAPESAELAFNLGTTYYRQGRYEQALASFEKALGSEDMSVVAKAHYNIGNVLVQQGKLREALEAYKRCLEITRDDEDAKYNIEYIQRKLKELASKQKEEQEKNPLNKLLKELEKLIALQAAQVAETRGVMSRGAGEDEGRIVEGLRTNEASYAARTAALTEGFRDVRTNLPPEQLMQGGGGGGGAAALPQDESTRELVGIYQTLARVARPVGEALQGGDKVAASNALAKAGAVLEEIEKAAKDDLNRQFASAGREVLEGLGKELEGSGRGVDASSPYVSLMENLERELRGRMEKGGSSGVPDASGPYAGKTLAQKIDNAIVYLDHAWTNLTRAAELLGVAWTNAQPEQVEGLEYLIRARKEFEEENQQQQQQQQGGQGQQEKKDKQDQKDQQQQGQDQQDQQNQQGEQDQKKEQQPEQGQQGQEQQEENQQQQAQGRRQQEQPRMDPEQVEQILRAFGEEQRNQQRARKQRIQAQGYMPVDKDW